MLSASLAVPTYAYVWISAGVLIQSTNAIETKFDSDASKLVNTLGISFLRWEIYSSKTKRYRFRITRIPH